MDIIFSDGAKDLMNKSRRKAEILGTPALMPEHMLLSMLIIRRSFAYKILSKGLATNILDKLKDRLEDDLKKKRYPQELDELARESGRIQLTEDFVILLKEAKSEAMVSNDRIVGSEHLLLSLLKNESLPVTQYLNKRGFTYRSVKTNIMPSDISNHFDDYQSNTPEQSGRGDYIYNKKQKEPSKTPILDGFARNLNILAKDGKLDPVIGREKEILRTTQILSRRKKNNVLLIGQPGVGKTAIAEGLAMEIVNNNVNQNISSKKVYALDMASLVAGTKYRGQFEERIKELIEELIQNQEIILFIDEIHTIIGAGGVGGGTLDASNILKPVLTDGRIQCVGATTISEYKKYIEKDGAFARRFHNILVEQPTKEETKEILYNIKGKYEKHHNVIFSTKVIDLCVELSEQYISDRYFPDKAIDIMDEAGSAVNTRNSKQPTVISRIQEKLKKIQKLKNKVVNSQKYEQAANLRDQEKKLEEQIILAKKKWGKKKGSYRHKVSEEEITKVVTQYARVPVHKINKQQNNFLINIAKVLQKKIVGQDAQIQKIVKTIQRARIGLKDPCRPIGSFIFLGPSGVGKTSLAKEIAFEIFGSQEALIRLDMSEYMEKFSVSGLIGAPPGYIGHEEGGKLTEKVYRNPYSVILLDEIEKSHPDVQNLLLQIMDNGIITDSLDRRVDFRNTIIIMTSNIGVKYLEEFGTGIGFQTDNIQFDINSNINEVLTKELKKYFMPEFLGRISEVMIFNSLNKEHIFKIINLYLDSLNKKIEGLGYKIKIDSKTKDFLIEKGYSSKYGVRPLLRTIQDFIEDPITEKIINSDIKLGDSISIKHNISDEKPTVFVIETANS